MSPNADNILLRAIVTTEVCGFALALWVWLFSPRVMRSGVDTVPTEVALLVGWGLLVLVAVVCLIWLVLSARARRSWPVRACLYTSAATALFIFLFM